MSARERNALLARHGIEPVFELWEILGKIRGFDCTIDFLFRRVGTCEFDVLEDRFRKNNIFLRHETDERALSLHGEMLDGFAVHKIALLIRIKTQELIDKRRFARARAPDNPHSHAALNGERNVLEILVIARRIRKIIVPHLKRLKSIRRLPARPIGCGSLENLFDAIESRLAAALRIHDLRKRKHRPGKFSDIEHKREKRPERNLPLTQKFRSVEKCHDIGDCRDDPCDRKKERGKSQGRDIAVINYMRTPRKFFLLAFFRSERTHDTHALDILHDEIVESALGFFRRAIPLIRDIAELFGPVKKEQKGRNRREREFPRRRRDHHDDEKNRHDESVSDTHDAETRHLRHALDIARHAVHKIPRAEALVEDGIFREKMLHEFRTQSRAQRIRRIEEMHFPEIVEHVEQ